MKGGKGDDTYSFSGNWGTDGVVELNGEGKDTLSFAGISADLTITIKNGGDVVAESGANKVTASNIENIIGGSGNTTFIFEKGAQLAGFLDGGAGVATLVVASGHVAMTGAKTGTSSVIAGKVPTTQNGFKNIDVVSGSTGKFSYTGFSGADSVTGGAKNDTLKGEAGADQLNGAGGADTLEGGAGNDTLNGGAKNDMLDGGAGNDQLNGGAGNDFLSVDAGNDTLTGGADNDTYYFGNDVSGLQKVVESSNGGEDTLDFSDLDGALTFNLDLNGIKISRPQVLASNQVAIGDDHHDKGGPISMSATSLGVTAPTVDDYKTGNFDFSFGLSVDNTTPFTISVPNLDANAVDLTPLSDPVVQVTGIGAGTVQIAGTDVGTLTIWQDIFKTGVDQSNKSESGHPVFLRDVAPTGGVYPALKFDLKLNRDADRFTVNVASNANKTAWLADIATAINDVVSGKVAASTEKTVSVDVSGKHMQINHIDGSRITIWPDKYKTGPDKSRGSERGTGYVLLKDVVPTSFSSSTPLLKFDILLQPGGEKQTVEVPAGSYANAAAWALAIEAKINLAAVLPCLA